jgi:general nucleoside transport system ATP-binding protein
VEKILELKGITKRFPGLVANDSISLTALKGEVHALVGENGAGKSTLMNIITGLYHQDEGEVWLRGEKLQLVGPRDAILKGIGMVHQHFMLVNRFTVVQNIILGFEEAKGGVIDFAKARAKVEELCRLYDFKLDLDKPVGELSVGHQQRVEILKVLYRGADILILDEPTAVLTPQEVEELFVNLNRLKAEGKVILFISHKLNEVLRISDQITVLRRGKAIGTVRGAETSKKQLAEMMVGRPVLFQLEKPACMATDAVLQMKNVSVKGESTHYSLNQLSLTVRRGEIYGVAGVEGNGQRELVETIMGLTRYDAGEIMIKGEDIKGKNVSAIRHIGVGYIPEDRHHRAVVLPMTVWENAVLGLHREPAAGSPWKLNIAAIKEFTARKIKEFDIRLSSYDMAIRNLSGGNQQKVVLARELSQDPDFIIASQPVRGLDIGAIEFVQKQLIEARNRCKGVLLISADLEEVLSVSDRVGIMYNGEIVKEFVPGELDIEEIGQYMLGASQKGGEAIHE